MNNMKFGIQPKNEVVNLKGNTHEDGGIPLSNDIEAENNESMIGNFMFSNRLVHKNNKTFSDKAKAIEKKYKKDKSNLAQKSKKIELERLAKEQEALKEEMQANTSENTGEPQQMAYGGNTKRKMITGGLTSGIMAGANAVGGLINVGRGIFEKPRQFDNVSFERAEANTIDLGEQRRSAALTSERNRQATAGTIRNNASSAGQLLGNTLISNARATDDLNRIQAESFMNEENTNAQILNQVDQFNTQIGNQETMTNFQIAQQNAANRDAQRQMMFEGFGQLLGAGSNYAQDRYQRDFDYDLMNRVYPNVTNNPKPYGNMNFMQRRGFRPLK